MRTTGFDPAPATGGTRRRSRRVQPRSPTPASRSFVGREIAKNDRPELTVGQDHRLRRPRLGSSDKFNEVLTPLADKLGAALGAARAAVDAGYAPNDWQVGQTGKIVAPQLYIAVGISRRDPAPGRHEGLEGHRRDQQGRGGADLQVADYGLVEDLFTAVPELVKAL